MYTIVANIHHMVKDLLIKLLDVCNFSELYFNITSFYCKHPVTSESV